jgi:hypothetical protein
MSFSILIVPAIASTLPNPTPKERPAIVRPVPTTAVVKYNKPRQS